MKKIISLCLIFCVIFCFSSCKKKDEKTATPTDLATKTDVTSSAIEVSSVASSSSVPDSSSSSETASAEEVCKHKFAAATCTKPKTCELCKSTVGKALGHKWEDATCQTLKTCTVCERKTGSIGDHTYDNGYCTLCKKKDPDFGSLTSHVWRLFKSSRLITIGFKNGAYSESVMVDSSTVEGDIYDASNVYTANGKSWYAIDGQGMEMSFKEEKGTITIAFHDVDYPKEHESILVLKRTSNTTLKVTKCTLKGSYWKIGVGDILTAVTQ